MKYQLGNYVTEVGKPGQILTVSGIDLKNLCVINGYVLNEETAKQARIIPVEMVEPIPLDAEWLERFSFKQVKLDRTPFYELAIENIKFLYYDGNLEFGVMGISQYEFVRMPKIKYVHQLQNLFFCLVGKDL